MLSQRDLVPICLVLLLRIYSIWKVARVRRPPHISKVNLVAGEEKSSTQGKLIWIVQIEPSHGVFCQAVHQKEWAFGALIWNPIPKFIPCQCKYSQHEAISSVHYERFPRHVVSKLGNSLRKQSIFPVIFGSSCSIWASLFFFPFFYL